MRVGVYWIGKTRLPGVAALSQEYAERLRHFCEMDAAEVRGARRRSAAAPGVARLTAEEENMASRARGGFRVVLDPEGKHWTSAEFAAFLGKQRDQAARGVAFFVGGADGFTAEFRRQAHLLLSLSPLTLPHELARVVLLEQLYRGFTMLANHPYPR